MQQRLPPSEFRNWRDAAEERAQDRSTSELIHDLVILAENGESMTMRDAKLLGTLYELDRRTHP